MIIVQEYDETLYCMILKCYHHLYLMVESKVVNVEQAIEEDCNLNIFKQISNTSEPMKKIVIKYLLIFQSYQMDCREIKCPLQWCGKHEIMFLTIDLLTTKF